jgi:hypothetical protein
LETDAPSLKLPGCLNERPECSALGEYFCVSLTLLQPKEETLLLEICYEAEVVENL